MVHSADSTERWDRALRSADRMARWPLVILVVVALTIIVCRASPLGPNFLYVVFGLPFLHAILIIAAVPAGISAIKAVKIRAWRKATSCAVLPVFVLANVPCPLAFVHTCNMIGNVIHFGIMRRQYLSTIRALPETEQPKLQVFNWGGMIWASNGVVYDESDEIVLPRGKQSASWMARANKTELGCGGYSITSMGGHFYLADFPC
jgi:hypothetical protein